MGNIWNELLIRPILNLLMGFYKGFSLLGLPGAFGLAIIALTILVRLILNPIMRTQLESAKKMQSLKPKLDELNAKHKNDKVKLQQAQLELYKLNGINPAAGCLPLLVQIPIIYALFNVVSKVFNGSTVDSINSALYHPVLTAANIDLNFFGLNLATKPSDWQKLGLGLLLIPIITGGLQYLQTKLMTPSTAKIATQDKAKPAEEDQMQSIQKQMMLMMPIMIGFFALSFPIGISLYWNTFTILGIIQQLNINKNK